MAAGNAGLQTGTARRRRATRRRFFLPAILFASSVVGFGCGGDGSAPTTPEPPEPAAPLDVPFGFTDLEEGEGPEVEDGWLLAIAYTGWLYDDSAPDNKGSEFISVSEEDPDSFRFGVGQVIPGIDRGMAGMRAGGKRRIVVPPDMGFGAQGNNLVPGNATLLFEVVLVAGAEVPFETIDLQVGSGEEAENGDSLSMAYHGWVYDLLAPDNKGDTFDSTTAENPFDFTLGVGAVIVGWDLGIVGMRVGGRRRIVIPHELAYGAAGRQPRIPPYATLLFEVELLAVE
ncbi:MAG: FKBP-type peptidyl-prolyl cis-trans isomerase [Acidobacteria bacterium]|nr:FKBP-type peptidyl-prolyl cis-trans isomerase [Acidobacteriota bacterium]